VKRCCLICLTIAGLGAGCAGGDDKSKPARPQPFLGVTSGALSSAPELLGHEMQVMADIGVTTVRAPFYWRSAQPAPRLVELPPPRRHLFRVVGARPTTFVETDRLVAAAARARIALLPVVLGTPSWASRHPGKYNSPPANAQVYAEFLRALVGRYGPSGSFWDEHPRIPKLPLRDWQLWNEPDHLHYWSDQPHARDYVRLARAARKAIKNADPGARVVMAGYADRSWDSITALYEAGARGVFDVVAIHPYTFEPRNVLRAVRFVRRTLDRAGDVDRPLWLTEVTWSSGRRPGHRPFPFETTRQDQARRLSEVFPLLLRNRRTLGIQRIYWENWLSTDRDHRNPFNFSGLRALRADGTVRRKPAFAAFKRVAVRLKKEGPDS
jgi:hypothetical protein